MSVDPRLKELDERLSPLARRIASEVLILEREHGFQARTKVLDKELSDLIAKRVKDLIPNPSKDKSS
jgi:hypothetical protein